MIVLFPLIGFWFWLVCAASLIWLFAAVYDDHYVQATVDLVLLVVLMSVTGNLHIAGVWAFVQHNPAAIVIGILGYLSVGVTWSLVKWRLMLRKFKALLVQSNRKNADNPSAEKSVPYSLEAKGVRLKDGKFTLQVDDFKSKIIGWMAYWWVSMPVWLIGDALHELFETLYLKVRSLYQRLADAALND